MKDNPPQSSFLRTPRGYGITSLAAACLAFLSWPLMVVIGFVMIYVAALLAFVAVIAGLAGIGTGIYHKDTVAVVAGALGLAMTCFGVTQIVSAVTHF